MKAIVKIAAQAGFELREIPEPKLKQKNEVKVRLIYSGICGTDLHLNQWDEWAKTKITQFPHVGGHEGIGQVVKIGSAVEKIRVGDYVALETHIFDGTCRTCKKGNFHVCENGKILGLDTHGTWSEYIVVSESILFKLDQTVPLKYCALLEPMGNAQHVLEGISLKDKNVLISGDGPIGMLTALIARTHEPKRLFITGINKYRQQIIQALGFKNNYLNGNNPNLQKEIMHQTKNEGIDVVLEMSGSISALTQAVSYLNPAGIINVLSLYAENMVALNLNHLVLKNATLNFITGRKLWSTWKKCYDLLKNETLKFDDLNKIITQIFFFTDFEQSFQRLKKQKAAKILLSFTQ